MNWQISIRVAAVLLAMSLSADGMAGRSDHRDQARAALGSKNRLLAALAARNQSAALTEAKSLGSVFRQMETYWQERGSIEAVRFAKDSVPAAAAVGKAVEGGDLRRAAELAKAISIACDTCHRVAGSKAP